MREIKFRAWDRTLSEMIYDIQDNQFINGDLIMGFGDYLWDSRYSVMQYTGLKDCDGNDIYEGDVLFQEDYYTSVLPSIVRFENLLDKWPFPFWLKTGECFKILGNVHQNPELMEEVEK